MKFFHRRNQATYIPHWVSSVQCSFWVWLFREWCRWAVTCWGVSGWEWLSRSRSTTGDRPIPERRFSSEKMISFFCLISFQSKNWQRKSWKYLWIMRKTHSQFIVNFLKLLILEKKIQDYLKTHFSSRFLDTVMVSIGADLDVSIGWFRQGGGFYWKFLDN